MTSLLSDLLYFGPEVMLALGSLILLVVGAFRSNPETAFATVFWSVVGLTILAIAALSHAGNETQSLFGGLVGIDGFSVTVKVILLALLGFSLLMLRPYCIQEKVFIFEMPLLVLLSGLGMLVVISARDLLSLYVGLELQAFCAYILTAIRRDNRLGSEAALKYFTLGALASGILLLGIALIYGTTGTTRYDVLEIALRLNAEVPSVTLIAGLVLLLCGFAFKLSAAPFHAWTPDVYQGAPTPVTALFAIVPKVAVVAALITLLYQPLSPLFAQWQQLVIMFAILSLAVGALGALRQNRIKRLMAYGTIGHAGYLLIAIACGTSLGVAAGLLSLIIYGIASVGVFSMLCGLRSKGVLDDSFARFAGLSKTHPRYAASLTICLLSMAGLPPLAGFFVKFHIFQAAIDAELIWLVIIGVIATVIAAFYYLRLVKIIYFDEPAPAFDQPIMPTLSLFSLLSPALLIGYILFPETLWSLAKAATIALDFS